MKEYSTGRHDLPATGVIDITTVWKLILPPGRRSLPSSTTPYSPTLSEHTSDRHDRYTVASAFETSEAGRCLSQHLRLAPSTVLAVHMQIMLFAVQETGDNFSVRQIDITYYAHGHRCDRKLQQGSAPCTSSAHAGAEHLRGVSRGQASWHANCPSAADLSAIAGCCCGGVTVQPVLFLSSLRTPSQSVLGELLQKNSSRGQQGMSVSEPQLGSAAWRCVSVDCEKRLQ